MSDWDASDDETTATAAAAAAPVAVPKVAPKKSKFADEDASDDDVKDDWDASDDEEEKKPAKPTGPAPPVRAKGITKQKIAEKEAAERAAAEERARRTQEENDPQLRKAREKAAMLKADLDSAATLFGSTAINDNPLDMRCSDKTDFENMATALAEQIINLHGSHPFYSDFTQYLARAICDPLKDHEVRQTASKLTTLANEKQAAAKAAAGGKKKKGAAKPALGASKSMGVGRADVAMYDEVLDDSGDYDDFM